MSKIREFLRDLMDRPAPSERSVPFVVPTGPIPMGPKFMSVPSDEHIPPPPPPHEAGARSAGYRDPGAVAPPEPIAAARPYVSDYLASLAGLNAVARGEKRLTELEQELARVAQERGKRIAVLRVVLDDISTGNIKSEHAMMAAKDVLDRDTAAKKATEK